MEIQTVGQQPRLQPGPQGSKEQEGHTGQPPTSVASFLWAELCPSRPLTGPRATSQGLAIMLVKR